MKITDVKAIIVRQPEISMIGDGSQDTVVIKVMTDEGITGIGESAFLGCMDLKSIDIPESVRYIGSTAFKRCTSLENIYFRHHCIEYDDLDIFDDAFSEVDFDRCVLHVPSGTRWAYRNHTLFSKFINIEIE